MEKKDTLKNNDAMIDPQKVREQSIDGIKLNSGDLKPNDFEGVDVSGFKSEAVDVMLDEIDNSEIKENTNNTPRHR